MDIIDDEWAAVGLPGSKTCRGDNVAAIVEDEGVVPISENKSFCAEDDREYREEDEEGRVIF